MGVSGVQMVPVVWQEKSTRKKMLKHKGEHHVFEMKGDKGF
jgi:hypothetical protein